MDFLLISTVSFVNFYPNYKLCFKSVIYVTSNLKLPFVFFSLILLQLETKTEKNVHENNKENDGKTNYQLIRIDFVNAF